MVHRWRPVALSMAQSIARFVAHCWGPPPRPLPLGAMEVPPSRCKEGGGGGGAFLILASRSSKPSVLDLVHRMFKGLMSAEPDQHHCPLPALLPRPLPFVPVPVRVTALNRPFLRLVRSSHDRGARYINQPAGVGA